MTEQTARKLKPGYAVVIEAGVLGPEMKGRVNSVNDRGIVIEFPGGSLVLARYKGSLLRRIHTTSPRGSHGKTRN